MNEAESLSKNFLIDDEPSSFSGKDLDKILVHTTQMGASDVTIQTNNVVLAEIQGKLRPITRHILNYSEVEAMLEYVTESSSAMSRINAAEAFDIAHQIKPDRFTRLRYRVNATALLTEGQTGVEITLRTIPSLPPSLKDLNLPPQILENRSPKQGMVLITGATGSGKSTLLAAIIRDLLEDPESHKKILTYEQPIEFVYDDVVKQSACIAQTQIPEMLPNFPEALRNALRRKPSVILIGEMRDRETIAEGVTASQTGHLLYSTLHTNGVPETVKRMVNAFGKDEQHSRAVDIISALKMIVSQMLLPSTDGKRVAIQEFLVMTDAIAEEMLDNIDNLPLITRKLLKEHGQTFLQDALKKYKEGRIDAVQLRYIQALNNNGEKDLEAGTTQNERGSF